MNIWTNGCFDILHTGHIDLLWFAKLYTPDATGNSKDFLINRLIVGLDSDERVRKLKDNGRPINDIKTRVSIMSNLKMVDEVVVFYSDDELRNYIKEFNIDYVIVGDQYKNKEVIGAENAKHGAVFFSTDDRSTTNIVEKIKKINEGNKIDLICFDIKYNNDIIKIVSYPYDVMSNMMIFNTIETPMPKFEELEFLEYTRSRFSGGVALDIGACIGNHSVFFSKFIFNKVFAFEPDMQNFTLLSTNKRNNYISDDKLILYNVALSDGNYKYRCRERNGDMGRTKVIEGDGELITKKLDEFDLPKIDFIKLDVEGHELKVLKGAVNLINRDFPDIELECNFYDENLIPIENTGFEEIDSYMEKLNYRMVRSFKTYMFYYTHKI